MGVFTLSLASFSFALIPGGLVGRVLSDKVAGGTCIGVMLLVGIVLILGIKGVLSGRMVLACQRRSCTAHLHTWQNRGTIEHSEWW